MESPENVLSTLGADGKRRWLYPIMTWGRYAKQRRVLGLVLVFLYLLLPVMRIGGRPAVLLDFINREFALFGLIFYPTDTFLLMLLGIALILTIAIGTALLGRVWCGWACPQTIYLEFVFRPIERWIEGKEHVRKRRDEGPTSFDKLARKGLKYLLFTAVALLLSHTFVAYFVGWTSLAVWATGAPADHIGFFIFMAVVSGMILFNFAYFREQMCTIVCPYARMQSVLLDEDSLIVSYDPTRGEARAKRSKKILREEDQGLLEKKGDCIDCFACVRTCPTGIDIRDGLQMECIACTQCIDACDAIMDKIEKPRGLISYTSENELLGKSKRLLRPRTLMYGLLLIGVFSMLGIGIASRGALEIDLGRVAGAPFTEMPDGSISNRVRFRLRNQSSTNTIIKIEAVYPANIQFQIVGQNPVFLEAGEMKRMDSWVIVPRDLFAGQTKISAEFRFTDSKGIDQKQSFSLVGPSLKGATKSEQNEEGE